MGCRKGKIMKKHFIAAVYAEGVHGEIITLKDDALYFTAHKRMTVPERYAKVMFSYDEIEVVFLQIVTWMGAVYRATDIVLKNGKTHTFIISGQKRFMKYMDMMCRW